MEDESPVLNGAGAGVGVVRLLADGKAGVAGRDKKFVALLRGEGDGPIEPIPATWTFACPSAELSEKDIAPVESG